MIEEKKKEKKKKKKKEQTYKTWAGSGGGGAVRWNAESMTFGRTRYCSCVQGGDSKRWPRLQADAAQPPP